MLDMYMSIEMMIVAVYLIAKLINKEKFGLSSVLFMGFILCPFKTIGVSIAGMLLWYIGRRIYKFYKFSTNKEKKNAFKSSFKKSVLIPFVNSCIDVKEVVKNDILPRRRSVRREK